MTKAMLSLLTPVRPMASTAPMTQPTPIAEFRYPTPAFPRPSVSTDSTTMYTWSAPNRNDCAARRVISTRSAGSRPIVRKPASASETTVPGSTSDFGAACGPRTRRSTKAEMASMAAVIANTTSGPVAASSTPANAGPAKTAMLSTVLATAFAAVSSSGVRASAGVSAACAERNGVAVIAAATAST